jgi:hypothetical protein
VKSLHTHVWYAENFPITKEIAEKIEEWERNTGKDSTELIIKLLEKFFEDNA